MQIPRLNLGPVGSGGGWGLGEQYAELPCAEKQRASGAKIFSTAKVAAAAAAHESDYEEDSLVQEPKAAAPVSTNIYRPPTPEEDDRTFVDHGSNASGLPVHKQKADNAAPPEIPKINFKVHLPNSRHQSKSQSRDQLLPPAASQERDDERTVYKAAEVISHVELPVPLRAMTICHKELWIAVGDDPICSMSLKGCDLEQNRDIRGVTSVRSMVFVAATPPSKPSGFKAHRGAKAAPEVPAEAQEPFLWCGLENGNISVCNMFFQTEDSAINGAHAGRVSLLFATPNGKVWSSGQDRVIRVWDPVSRRSAIRKTLPVALHDICACPTTKHIFTTSLEANVRVWEYDGREVRFPKTLSNVWKMPSVIRCVRYNAHTDTIWACAESEIIILNPQTMKEQRSIPIDTPCLEFVGRDGSVDASDMAIVVGTYGKSTEKESRLMFIDAVSSEIIARGSEIVGVSQVGIRCFSSEPLGVIAHADNDVRHLSLFPLKEMNALGHWGLFPGYNGPSGDTRQLEKRKSADAVDDVATGEEPTNSGDVVTTDEQQFDSQLDEGSSPPAKEDTEPIVEESFEEEGEPGSVEERVPEESRAVVAPAVVNEEVMFANAQALVSLREMQEQLAHVHKTVRALKTLQPVQHDFGVIYAKLMKLQVELGAVLKPETVEDCETTEGKMMMAVLNELEKSVNATKERHGSSCSDPSSDREDASPRATLLDNGTILKQLKELTRASQSERNWHQQQFDAIAALNRETHNRNNVMVAGLSALDQAIKIRVSECRCDRSWLEIPTILPTSSEDEIRRSLHLLSEAVYALPVTSPDAATKGNVEERVSDNSPPFRTRTRDGDSNNSPTLITPVPRRKSWSRRNSALVLQPIDMLDIVPVRIQDIRNFVSQVKDRANSLGFQRNLAMVEFIKLYREQIPDKSKETSVALVKKTVTSIWIEGLKLFCVPKDLEEARLMAEICQNEVMAVVCEAIVAEAASKAPLPLGRRGSASVECADSAPDSPVFHHTRIESLEPDSTVDRRPRAHFNEDPLVLDDISELAASLSGVIMDLEQVAETVRSRFVEWNSVANKLMSNQGELGVNTNVSSIDAMMVIADWSEPQYLTEVTPALQQAIGGSLRLLTDAKGHLSKLYGQMYWYHVWFRYLCEALEVVEVVLKAPTAKKEAQDEGRQAIDIWLAQMQEIETELLTVQMAFRRSTDSFRSEDSLFSTKADMLRLYLQLLATASSAVPSVFVGPSAHRHHATLKSSLRVDPCPEPVGRASSVRPGDGDLSMHIDTIAEDVEKLLLINKQLVEACNKLLVVTAIASAPSKTASSSSVIPLYVKQWCSSLP